MRLSSVLGLPIEDSSGHCVGHVVDVRFNGADLRSAESTFVLYGARSFLDRLGFTLDEKKLPMPNILELGATRIKTTFRH